MSEQLKNFKTDTFSTSSISQGDLLITSIGHGSLMCSFDGKVIHVDPYAELADYSALPKADLVLITHEHADHFNYETIKKASKPNSTIILTETCAKKFVSHQSKVVTLKNGERIESLGLHIIAVAAYNIVHKNSSGGFYHPKGIGNGYIISFADKNVYVAGDTENTPEMKALQHIDIAFLPMNLPYTMTPAMIVDAVKAFKPKVLYPYHMLYSTTSNDLEALKGLMKNLPDIILNA